ncbi:MAG: hypothetical protein WAK10_05305 [Methanoregula sp.]
MWGDWLLVNVQWALFRYQQSEYGTSLILGYKDILYIYLGQNTGWYNIAAALFWTTGAVILLIGLYITIISCIEQNSEKIRTASYFTLSGGTFLCLSAICRFFGGFAIPVGVPVILILGWWMYQGNFEADDTGQESGDEEGSAPE